MRSLRSLAGLCLLCFVPAGHAGLLVDLYRQALFSEPGFAAAQAQRDAALDALPLIRSEILPSLYVSGQASRLRDDSEQSRFVGFEDRLLYASTWQLGVSLRQPLLDWSVFARLRQIDEKSAVAELALIDARQRLMLDLVARYLDWLAAGDVLLTLNQQEAALEQLLRQLQTRVETGYATSADLQEVLARRDQAVADKLRAAAAVRAAREAVRQLAPRVPTLPQALRGEIETHLPEPADPEVWVARALRHNPALRRAELEAELAAQTVKAERGRYWPTLELRAEHSVIDTDELQLGREAETSLVMLRLDVPLYTGGANTARARSAASLHERSLHLRDAERREVDRQTRDAYDGIVTGIERLRAARQSVQSQQAALQAVQGGVDTGLKTVAEMLDARQRVYAAQGDLAAARYAYLMSVLNLKAVVGDLVDADLLTVDTQLAAD